MFVYTPYVDAVGTVRRDVGPGQVVRQFVGNAQYGNYTTVPLLRQLNFWQVPHFGQVVENLLFILVKT